MVPVVMRMMMLRIVMMRMVVVVVMIMTSSQEAGGTTSPHPAGFRLPHTPAARHRCSGRGAQLQGRLLTSRPAHGGILLGAVGTGEFIPHH